ncbi:hypothetical protein [Paenibacillus pini]|uniref:Uncharacterized protein n=1 Tax=Paenibacillus pini JCM 16418 TaxID=1236976 RepID=W7Z8M1_9BACL|nr:hypothetical protein [Paenibacillus pini]GAF10789.1 hypothetical protein JCM16418_5010 [Paenibacillus pini JCM 16418]
MSKIVKIYDSVIENINQEINHSINQGSSTELKKEHEAYIAGLKAALQFVESENDLVYEDCAYEKFEEILLSYLDVETNQSTSLYPENIKDIVLEHMKDEFNEEE